MRILAAALKLAATTETRKARFVDEPLAVVAARDRYQAEDAPLPVVVWSEHMRTLR